jgi:predicted nucleic acid-binding Zn ribbon protein
MTRLVPQTGRPKFSGSGFYETDYKKSSKKPLEKANGSKDKKNE